MHLSVLQNIKGNLTSLLLNSSYPTLQFGIKDHLGSFTYENRDMAIAMSSSRADLVLGFNIPSSCPGWGDLNI